MDTIDEFLRHLDYNELEALKSSLVSALIEKRIFHRFKFLGKSFVIAVDGTAVTTYDREYSTECLSKTSQKGVTSYQHGVLEAKLVTGSGLSISLATEWLSNEENNKLLNKQDSELQAFKRLAPKIKRFFPRLPVCIVADALYPNYNFMKICKEMNWNYIITLKDGCLKALQREIAVRALVSGTSGQTLGNSSERIIRQG